ncbi:hypothetical protein SLEP1_g6080 [Rubroshorea leprosula]|uniref:Uncharacterized protein n=1 Tax=Rubroshorea leprosula TaxID=152421 RepID=A0AAV5I259_9ROSI|nr:hypothetical protein SLEP1_g6080 [Rubroshorea leprosula]
MIVIKGRVESKKGSYRSKMIVVTKQMHKSNKASVGFCICCCSGSRTISIKRLARFSSSFHKFHYAGSIYIGNSI